MLHNRHIPLEGTFNLRDLGGYPTADGCALRWRRLLRSDALHRLTDHALADLQAYDLRTVIDLRFEPEAAAAPSLAAKLHGVKYYNLPLHDDPIAPAFNAHLSPSQLPQTLGEYYCMLLDHCQKRIGYIFDLLSQPDEMPSLIHCTAGKDRTGMIVMLVLLALGVPRAIIIEDYLMTGEYAAELLQKLERQMHRAGIDVEWHRRMLECSPRAIKLALDHLDRKHGGIIPYLYRANVTPEQLTLLRAALLEPIYQPTRQL